MVCDGMGMCAKVCDGRVMVCDERAHVRVCDGRVMACNGVLWACDGVE